MFQFTSGSVLGRYELLVPIASGGMAEVWAARLHGNFTTDRVSQRLTKDSRPEYLRGALLHTLLTRTAVSQSCIEEPIHSLRL